MHFLIQKKLKTIWVNIVIRAQYFDLKIIMNLTSNIKLVLSIFLKKQGYESEVILDAIKCLQMNNINEFKINLGNVGIARKYLDKLGLNNSLVEFF